MAIAMNDLNSLAQQLLSQGGAGAQQFLQTLMGSGGDTGFLQKLMQQQNDQVQNSSDIQGQVSGTLNPINSQSISDLLSSSGVNTAQPQLQLPGSVPQLTDTGSGVAPIGLPTSTNPSSLTNEGLDPATMAALTSGNIQKNAQEFGGQAANLKQALAQRGIMGNGAQPGSGLAVDPLVNLASQQAQANSGALTSAAMSNQDQLNKNRALAFQMLGLNTNAGLTQRGQDITQQGQTLDTLLGQRGQDVTQQGQLLSTLLGQRGQDVTSAGQNVTQRGQTLDAAGQNNVQNINAQSQTAQNDLQRRNLLLQALQGGNQTLGQGSQLAQLLLNGYGTATGQQGTSLSNLTTQKGQALTNDVANTGQMLSPLNAVLGSAGAGIGGAMSTIGSNLAANIGK